MIKQWSIVISNLTLKLHKKIYNYNKKKAHSYEGPTSHILKKYRQNLNRLSLRSFSQSNENELLNSIQKSNFIYLGDFHTFDQNSKNLERIINHLISKNKKIVLCLEMIQDRHQIFIDAFLSGDLTELEFLESINYHESWRFPWNHYRVLFTLAKEHQFRIEGINSIGDLKTRDTYAASLIAQKFIHQKNYCYLILFGELHIVPNKIPELVFKNLTQYKVKQTIIHQNLDSIYWKLRSKNKNWEIIKFNKNEFSLQNSPPWIKYESQIYWYENLADDPEFDIHDYLIEKGSHLTTDNFYSIASELNKILKLNLKKDLIEDFNLINQSEINKIEMEVNHIKNKSWKNYYNSLITKSKHFKLINSNSIYCSNYSLNRLTYLAGIHLFHTLLTSNQKKIILKNKMHTFSFYTLEAMFGHLASKLINPFRKCNLYQDIKNISKLKRISENDRNSNQLCLEILDKKKVQYNKIKKLNNYQSHLIAKILGHYLGEVIYLNLSKLKKESFNKIVFDFEDSNFLIKILEKYIFSTNYQQDKKRFF